MRYIRIVRRFLVPIMLLFAIVPAVVYSLLLGVLEGGLGNLVEGAVVIPQNCIYLGLTTTISTSLARRRAPHGHLDAFLKVFMVYFLLRMSLLASFTLLAGELPLGMYQRSMVALLAAELLAWVLMRLELALYNRQQQQMARREVDALPGPYW